MAGNVGNSFPGRDIKDTSPRRGCCGCFRAGIPSAGERLRIHRHAEDVVEFPQAFLSRERLDHLGRHSLGSGMDPLGNAGRQIAKQALAGNVGGYIPKQFHDRSRLPAVPKMAQASPSNSIRQWFAKRPRHPHIR